MDNKRISELCYGLRRLRLQRIRGFERLEGKQPIRKVILLIGKKNIKKTAFTLVEIMAVLVIIGIVTVIGVKGYNQSVENAKMDACETDLRTFSQGFSNYILDYSRIEFESSPSTKQIEEVTGILNRNYLPAEITNGTVSGALIKCQTKTKKDPWNNPYHITITWNNKAGGTIGNGYGGYITVRSYGPDGKAGTASTPGKYSKHFGDDIFVVIQPNVEA